jgi:GNAT superfamily N-acetyltransferase
MDRISLRPMARTTEDLVLFSDAFRRHRSAKSIEFLRWQYFENPGARTYASFALEESSGRLVAVYGVCPIPVRIGGSVTLGGLSVNALTDPDYRGQGLFVKVASSVDERCRREGLAFVCGFANDNSVHGLRTYMHWYPLDLAPEMVRPLSLKYFVRRAPGLRSFIRQEPDAVTRPLRFEAEDEDARGIRALSGFGPETDELWCDFCSDIKVAIERDHDFMDWRFRRKPDRDYSIMVQGDKERLNALVVYAVTNRGGETVGHVMELLHRADATDAALLLLEKTLAVFRSCGCTAAHCLCLAHSPNHGVFRKAGFIDRPRLLRRSLIHFGVRPLAHDDPTVLASRDNWYVSYADYDTI